MLRGIATPSALKPLLAALGIVLLAAPAGAEVTRLTLWERTFRAGLVVVGTVLDGDDRLALIQVDDVVKGRYDRPTLRILFRARNMARQPWEQKIVFETGTSVVLFLTATEPGDDDWALDRFELVRGYQGKESIPPEGAPAFLDAIRRFGVIQGLDSQLAIWEAAKQLLREGNPHLVEAGFQQVLRFRLADEALVPDILPHLDSPTVGFREHAARALAQVFEESRRDEKVLVTEDHIRDLLLHKAMTDPSEGVRVESIKALEARSDPNLVPALRRIALEDPAQAVRYQAERAIYEIEAAPPPSRTN